MKPTARLLLPALLTGALGLAACGDSSGADTASTATTAASTANGAATTSATTSGSDDVATVSANDASQAEIAAALEAAGVPSADRWADEIVEYRPYDPADDWARLREELAKYNPPAGVIDQIISVLEP